jgi:hypothetical protein
MRKIGGVRNHLAYPVPIIGARKQTNSLISISYINKIRP